MRCSVVFALAFVSGCSGSRSGSPGPTELPDGFLGQLTDLSTTSTDSGSGCSDPSACEYTVFAHSDTVLYRINLTANSLEVVGPFNLTNEPITDLAIAPNDTIYVISKSNLFMADPNDGHATRVGSIQTCGTSNVALSMTPDGKLWVGDGDGAFCEIDVSSSTPVVRTIGTLGGTRALAGDLVAISDGTLFGTVFDKSVSTTYDNNYLVTINPTTGRVSTTLGQTGFPRLFGTAYAHGKVFGFTHDGTGRVITIDPQTGRGTLFNTFIDPTSNTPIKFAGAGVNPKVSPIN